VTSSITPLFGAGTARGGTGLVVQTLRANSHIELAMEPFLTVFKHYRLAVHRKLAESSDSPVPAFNDPIRALYFDPNDLEYGEKILGNPGDYEISSELLAELQAGVKQRAEYDAADLMPFTDSLAGSTFSEFFASTLSMIQEARPSDSMTHCGFLENWCAEFFPFLADHFPEAKFFLVVRDPRAVINSALHAPPELRSTLLSFARSVRKNLDLFAHYSEDPRFRGRLCIVKFEALAKNPEKISRQFCDFLEVDYQPEMIDPNYHVVPGTTVLRDGVSSFEANVTGYSLDRANRWRQSFAQHTREFVDGSLYPELAAFGYVDPATPPLITDENIEAVIADPLVSDINPKWLVEMHPDSVEYNFEKQRAAIFAEAASDPASITESAARENFISERVMHKLVDITRTGKAPDLWQSLDDLVLV
jgi:hypothetical protein